MKNISKTLYIPLYGKALVSRKGIILHDPMAENIWQADGFPLRGKAKSKWLAYYMGMRSRVFDRWTEERMAGCSGAVVLHIGCGLDSRAFRLADARTGHLWYDVDFPDVIGERRRHFSGDDGYRMLAADAQQTGWIDELPQASAAIVVMEGVSMYLEPDALRSLLVALKNRFPRLHVLMDCYTSFGVKASRYKNPINSVGVTLTYGLDEPEKLAENTSLTYLQELSMTPEDLIAQLGKLEGRIFRKLFAGGFASRIYRMYEFEAVAAAEPEAVTKQAAADLAAADSLNAANQYLDGLTVRHEGFAKISNNLYRFGDILFNTGVRFLMEAHARGLKAVKDWGIFCAPELLDYLRLKDGKSCVLITRVQGAGESMPVPLSGCAWDSVSPDGVQQFLADTEQMCGRGLIPDTLLHTEAWHVISSSGRIVISNWSRLCQLESGAAERVMEKVRGELKSRGLV